LHGVTEIELQSNPAVPVFLKERNLIELNDLDRYLHQLKTRIEKDVEQQEAGL
jgi:hypothetical protein